MAYIRQSRGEFSCAKPSCMKFQNSLPGAVKIGIVAMLQATSSMMTRSG
jgi:hypothetical protein